MFSYKTDHDFADLEEALKAQLREMKGITNDHHPIAPDEPVPYPANRSPDDTSADAPPDRMAASQSTTTILLLVGAGDGGCW